MEYYIGNILPEFIGRSDVVQLDMTDSGAFMIIALSDPTQNELRTFIYAQAEIRLTCFKRGMWFTLKFGQLAWMDAPYTPHLSYELHIPDGLDLACSGLTIMIIDTSDGRILYMGRIDYEDEFAEMVKTSVLAMNSLKFDRDDYDRWLEQMRSIYLPQQIAEKALGGFIFGGQ